MLVDCRSAAGGPICEENESVLGVNDYVLSHSPYSACALYGECDRTMRDVSGDQTRFGKLVIGN